MGRQILEQISKQKAELLEVKELLQKQKETLERTKELIKQNEQTKVSAKTYTDFEAGMAGQLKNEQTANSLAGHVI